MLGSIENPFIFNQQSCYLPTQIRHRKTRINLRANDSIDTILLCDTSTSNAILSTVLVTLNTPSQDLTIFLSAERSSHNLIKQSSVSTPSFPLSINLSDFPGYHTRTRSEVLHQIPLSFIQEATICLVDGDPFQQNFNLRRSPSYNTIRFNTLIPYMNISDGVEIILIEPKLFDKRPSAFSNRGYGSYVVKG